MNKVVLSATPGTGGNLQPLVVATLGHIQSGHQITMIGGRSVTSQLQDMGFETAYRRRNIILVRASSPRSEMGKGPMPRHSRMITEFHESRRRSQTRAQIKGPGCDRLRAYR